MISLLMRYASNPRQLVEEIYGIEISPIMNTMLSACRILGFILFAIVPVFLASPIADTPCPFQGGCVPPENAAKTVYVASSKQPPSESKMRALSTSTYLEIPPRLVKCHARITDQLSQLSPVLSERSQLSDFMDGGYKLVWHNVQVIVHSATAYDRHNRIYDKLLHIVEKTDPSTNGFAQLGGNTARIALTYGSLKLMVENLPEDHIRRRQLLGQLALMMLSLFTVGIVFGVYEVAIVAAKTVIWVTFTIMEAGAIPELIAR